MDEQYNNVTYRKPCRTSSLNDLSDMTSNSEKTLFDATMMSIPDSLHDDTDIIKDLSERVKTLAAQLQTAHQEIENLNSENFRLKTDLQNMLKTVNTYKKVCSTPERKSPKTPVSARKRKTVSTNVLKTLHNNCTDNPSQSPRDCAQKLTTTHDKETQTISFSNTQTVNKPPKECTSLINTDKKSPFSELENNIDAKRKQKKKLCILSSYKSKWSLSLTEDVFSDYFHFCNYVTQNGTIKELLRNIENKLKDFTLNDYCIIFIGENDIKTESNHIEVIKILRESIKNVTHTNIIISLPTYIAGAPIYNFKIEMFNNLLHLDIQNNNYAYLFDSNRDISMEMLSQTTGKINKLGMKNIYDCIMKNIIVDWCTFDQIDKNKINCEKLNNTSTNSLTIDENKPIRQFFL